ncbi:MAG: hypothetical protein WC986_14705 [Elusimicrobiota bacterium]|jgi:hypothetical protein
MSAKKAVPYTLNNADGTFYPTPAPEKRTKPKSRPARWAEACAEARKALDEAREKMAELQLLLDDVNGAFEGLKSVQEEYEEWQGNMNENLASSPTGEKLEAVTSIDIPSDIGADDLDSAEAALDECEGADLPRGFGND